MSEEDIDRNVGCVMRRAMREFAQGDWRGNGTKVLVFRYDDDDVKRLTFRVELRPDEPGLRYCLDRRREREKAKP